MNHFWPSGVRCRDVISDRRPELGQSVYDADNYCQHRHLHEDSR